MEPPHCITITFEKPEAEKLVALAQDPAQNLVIHLRYVGNRPYGYVVDQTSLNRELYVLIGRRNHLETEIAALQHRLKQLSCEYTSLMARIHQSAHTVARHINRALH